MEPTSVDIRNLSLEEIQTFFLENDQPKFRAQQVYDWLWNKSAKSFDVMTNLPLITRETMATKFHIHSLSAEDVQKSTDGTIKSAFKLYDNRVVEGVLIPTDKRMTACISSQVGCSLSCNFCATGKLKRMRNLDASEIFDQVEVIAKQAKDNYNINLSNIVYMGMGEPLLNYKNVLASVDKITGEYGLGMSPKRITISTAGIDKMIRKLGDDKVKFNLALSLHAANDKKRDTIMPINETNTLDTLAEALKHFYNETGTRVTYEYIIFKGFNDTLEDAEDLFQFTKHVPCKINIIEYNAIDDGEFQQASKAKVDAFATYLEERNVVINIRRSRGKDIDAACGQLANKNTVAD